MTENREQDFSQWIALVTTTISAFLTPLSMAMVNIALPVIAKEFPASAVTLSWIAMAYTLSGAVFIVPFGKIADIYGRKKIFLVGTGIFSLACLAMVFSPGLSVLISLRAIQGLGSAMVFGTSVAILTSSFPVNKRGRVLGINVAAVYLGLSLGPFLGGVLTQHFGWRSIFFINVPLGLIVVVLSLWKLKGEWADAKGERIDYKGSFVYCLATLSLMYGFSVLPDILGAFLVLCGIIGLIAFVHWETKVEIPIFNVSLFRHNRTFVLSNVAHLISYAATTAVVLLLSFYLQFIRGFTPQYAGLILVAQPIVQTVLSPIAGRVSDRVEPRFLSSAGMMLTALGLFLFFFLREHTSILYIVANLVILGIGFALFSSPNSNAIMGSVEKRFYGAAASLLSTMRLFGQMFSMGIAMLIFAVYTGKTQITPASYGDLFSGIRVTFVIFGILCLFGVLASFTRGNVREPH